MEKMAASVGKIFWMGMNYASRKGGEMRQIAKAVECGMEALPVSISPPRSLQDLDASGD